MILKADNLVKKYKKRKVVNDVSVVVEQGEIVGLLGPNGAGKTTSFYMIVGLVENDAGNISLNGTTIDQLPMHRRAKLGIGYLEFADIQFAANVERTNGINRHRSGLGSACARSRYWLVTLGWQIPIGVKLVDIEFETQCR